MTSVTTSGAGSALTRTFAALADPVRLAIVERLVESDATVGELAGMFEVSFQAVSQHIGVLEHSGLVVRHREGRTRRVQLQPAALEDADRWMGARRARLEERYARLDELLEELSAKKERP